MLASKALLIYVHISRWTGRKLDRTATNTVARAHDTESTAGNYTKKLLPGSRELARVEQIAGQIRKYFHTETHPWFSDGARIIKGSTYFEFVKQFNRMKADYEKAVDEFLRVYPFLQQHAQTSLGSLYSAAEYPDITSLKFKFKCEVKLCPLPDASDFRIDVTEEEKRAYLETMESVSTKAMKECWSQLFDVVQNAAQRLSDPSAIFKAALLDNITKTCGVLSRLNINDDPTFEAKRVEVEKLASKLSADVLRDNASERSDAAKKLSDITKSMGAFMGGAQ